MTQDPLNTFLHAPTDDLVVEPLLDAIDARAVDANATRSVDAELILAIKRSGWAPNPDANVALVEIATVTDVALVPVRSAGAARRV